MLIPDMPCSACHGRGRVPLPPMLLETLELLKRGPATAGELKRRTKSKLGVTAWNNRLADLYRMGHVSRTAFSKAGRGKHGWLYSLPMECARKASPSGAAFEHDDMIRLGEAFEKDRP